VKIGSVAAKTIAAAPPRLDAPLFALEQPVQPPPSPFVFDPLPSSAVSPVDADASSRRVAAQDDPATIYSFENGEVKPPVMLYPQLPPPLLIGSPAEALVNRMELVVAADGSVERVRLVNTPRRMADMMLLSGAKLWKFAPALKDGAPVRYRTIVSWTVFP
jgi:outer membrane biosynthesis protein TonB